MLLKIVLGLAKSIIIRQLVRYKDTMDIAKLMASLEPKIRKVIPGEWLDDEAVAFVNKTIEIVAKVVSKESLNKLASLVQGKDVEGAFIYLKQLILGALAPQLIASDVSDEQLIALIQAA